MDAADVAIEDLASQEIQTLHPVSRIKTVLKLHVAAKKDGPVRSAHPDKSVMKLMAKIART